MSLLSIFKYLNPTSAIASTVGNIITSAFSYRQERTALERELELEKLRAAKDAAAERAAQQTQLMDADAESVRLQASTRWDDLVYFYLLVALPALLIHDVFSGTSYFDVLVAKINNMGILLTTLYLVILVGLFGVRSIFTSLGDWVVNNRSK